ncbi:DUF5343 domain-containing protein [Mycobacteroides abscessus]|uniref:DUF5343 domain-containing protein n=1 Tax=Mycobacteroides abscessus TaxID=36809 RepID=UPI0021044D49|nr:DUF5343 domain-containing protein [Mycobacteroides abscessus]
MAAEVEYMVSNTNLPEIMAKIRSAGTPPKFTHDFLKSNLGFSSSNDRAAIKLLKALGFLTNDGTPTARYNAYRGADPGQALAEGLREGWAPFFLSDQKIYEKTSGQIQAIAKNITGAGDAVAKKMASTFKTLVDLADFTTPPADGSKDGLSEEDAKPPTGQVKPEGEDSAPVGAPAVVKEHHGVLTLSHDIHLHLPPTSDVSVYRAIFQAMKSELM